MEEPQRMETQKFNKQQLLNLKTFVATVLTRAQLCSGHSELRMRTV